MRADFSLNTKPYFKLNSSIELLYLSGTLSPKILYNISLLLLLFWCPYMVSNVSVQCYGGLLTDIILLTLRDSIGEQ